MPKKTQILKSSWKTLSELTRREFKYLLFKPRNLLLFLTYGCTSRCKICTAWRRERHPGELSLDEYKELIDQIAPLGIEHVELLGGEPLLRPEVLFGLIEHITGYGIQKDLVTNCSLMDQATAEKIACSGLDKIAMSIDGVGDVHDRVRGVPGFFDKAVKGVKYIIESRGKKKKPILVCNCTISKWNVHDFDEVLDFACNSGFDEAHFEYVGEFPPHSLEKSKIDELIPTPTYVWQESSVLVNTKEAEILKCKIEDIKRKAKKMDNLYVSTKNIDSLSIDDLTRGIFPHKRCYVCRSLVTVDPYGNIVPCPFFNNYFLGNIKDEKFSALWNNSRHRRFVHLQANGELDMCRYCILSVERNPTFWESIAKAYRSFGDRYGE
ncbi:MAG: radical SAM protein [candidate division Zixibacteria bacterium]|nr:radical SAM protein [candidate division Zixibacteria bacterium]